MSEIQIDSFKGIAPKYGSNLPVGYAETAINCGLHSGKLAPLAKNSLVEEDANHYNSLVYYNGAWKYGDDKFYCPWKINDLDLLLYKDDSGYLKKIVTWTITNDDISFDSASKEIRSASNQFNINVFIEGKQFTISGSANNDGTFTVSSTDTTTGVITVDEAVVNEDAGADVTVTMSEEDYLGQTRQGVPTAEVSASLSQLGWWSEIADLATGYTDIIDVTYNAYDGYIYGVSSVKAGLLRLSGNEWEEVAPAPGGEGVGFASCAANRYDGSVWCGSMSTGIVYRWAQGTSELNAWGSQLGGTETKITSLISGEDVGSTFMYCATYPNGQMYRCQPGETWDLLAVQYGTETTFSEITFFKGLLYAASETTGKLFYASGGTWHLVADQLGTEVIFSLCVHAGYLYGGTSPLGKLYKWNGVDAWTEAADQLGVQTAINSLCSLGAYLYGGTSPNGMCYKYDNEGLWVEVAATTIGVDGDYLTTDDIWSLVEANSVMYAGSGPNGSLLQYVPSGDPRENQYFITLTRNVAGHIDESGPSTVLDDVWAVDGQPVEITVPDWVGLGDSTNVTHWNIYRNNDEIGAWELVATVVYGTTSYVDSVMDANLGDTPASYFTSDQGNEIIYDIPQQNFDGITTIPMYGMILAWEGGNLYWCEPAYPDAWPGFYNMNFPAAIKNVIPFGGSFAVLTEIGPFTVTGNNPELLQQSPPLGNAPAMSVLGCCRSTRGVYYLSDSGVALFDLTNVQMVTDEGFGEEWFKDNISSTGAVMIEADNIVYLFHSAGGLIVDARPEIPIATTLSEIIYGAQRKIDDDDLYVMDASGVQKFGGASSGTKAMTWKSGELLGDDPEEKSFIETELLSDSEVAVVATNYVDGTSSSTATLAMTTNRDKRLGFLDEKSVGRSAQIQIYKAAHDTLTPSGLEIKEAIVRYTR